VNHIVTRSLSLRTLLPLALLLGACSGNDASTDAPTESGGSGQGATGGSAGKGGASAAAGKGGASGAAGAQAGAGGVAGAAGAGKGGAAGSGGKIACETTNDCAGFVPETKPAGCAKAICDESQKFCRFVAKDLDGDGDPSNSCKSQDPAVNVELGGDCDEADDKVNSKAWDGPEGLFGGKAQPNRCDDGVDNDCNGKVDDSKLDNGETCKCVPGDVRKCSEDSSGKLIKFPGDKPQGECKFGNQTCGDTGKWGPCTNAVGPVVEECNGGKDDDCDGLPDDADPDVSNQSLWFCDGDNDSFAAVGSQPVKSCQVPSQACPGPAGSWKLDIPSTDCDDTRPDVNVNAPEICGGAPTVDENCNGLINEGCSCDNGTTQLCFLDPTNQLIPHDGDVGIGQCTPGTQLCTGGFWGACLGGKGPEAETCANEGQDNDCDGDAVEANGAVAWYWDADGDLHGDQSIPSVFACAPPSTAPASCQPTATTDCTFGLDKWRSGIQADDCNDKDNKVKPGAQEICDNIDQDCDGQTDESASDAPFWYRDDDGDGYLNSDKSKIASKKQCAPPGEAADECPDNMAPCTGLWLKEGTAIFEDCNDASAAVRPGAWDGPEARVVPYGIAPPGIAFSYYHNDLGNNFKQLVVQGTVLSINFDWGLGSPDPKVDPDYFTNAWSGKLSAPQTGKYTFHVSLDPADYGAIYFDDKQNFCLPSTADCDVTVDMLQGVDVKFDLHVVEHTGPARVKLTWEGPGVPLQVLATRREPPQGDQPSSCDDIVDNDCNGQINDSILTDAKIPGFAYKCNSACDPFGNNADVPTTQTCGNGVKGICHPGAQSCQPDGAWGACSGEAKPEPAELCKGDGLDYNCNGITNTATGPNPDCNCTAGATQSCQAYQGPGWCGTTSCQNNQWNTSSCSQPPRDCSSANDNNCDGKADNIVDGGYCKCAVNATQGCSTRLGFAADGSCTYGQATCLKAQAGTSDWGACSGSAIPANDSCQTRYDSNCDGKVGNAPGCIKLVYSLAHPSWGPNCNPAPIDILPTGAPGEGGYQSYGFFKVWTGQDSTDSVNVYRCLCPGGYHTLAVAQDCPSIGCFDEGFLGYVSKTPGPGKEPLYLKNDYYNKGKGGCSSFLGCLPLSCGAFSQTSYYSPKLAGRRRTSRYLQPDAEGDLFSGGRARAGPRGPGLGTPLPSFGQKPAHPQNELSLLSGV
jgi:hypothetical protein